MSLPIRVIASGFGALSGGVEEVTSLTVTLPRTGEALDVRRVRTLGTWTREARSQTFTECRFEDADAPGRVIGAGNTFALQAHDPKSVIMYKNIRVKPLKD